MTNCTIAWVLRFAFAPFLIGLIMLATSGYTLLVYAPSIDPSAPWVPAAFAWGDMPWFLGMVCGLVLVLNAWRTGAQARRGGI